MRQKTSGNTCARPISPTACSKPTPQSSTLASSHGVAFSTSSVASSPSPAGIGLLQVNHSEVWYKLPWQHSLQNFERISRTGEVGKETRLPREHSSHTAGGHLQCRHCKQRDMLQTSASKAQMGF